MDQNKNLEDIESTDASKETEQLHEVNDPVVNESAEPVETTEGAHTPAETTEAELPEGDETPDDEAEEIPEKKSHKGAIIAGVLCLIAVVAAAAWVFFVALSPKAQFLGAFEDIFARHIGNTEDYEGLADLIESGEDWSESFSADFDVTTNDTDEKTLSLDYNSSAALLELNENDILTKLYLDKDNMVLTDGNDPAYSLSVSPLEAHISEQDNAFLNTYKSVFEMDADSRNEMSEDLLSILNDNLSRQYFEECIAEKDGAEYDGIRFYVAENEAATLLASILEDIDNSENEYLRLKISRLLVTEFGVTRGADISATLKNAMDAVTDTPCTVEMMMGFESGQPIMFSVNLAFGDFTFNVEYSFIRNGNTAKVYFDFASEGAAEKILFVYDGTRTYEENQQTETGEVMLAASDTQTTQTLSGEFSAVYSNEKPVSVNVALSSEDLNDRVGFTLSLTDNFSLSLTQMTDGWGNSIVLTADRKKSEDSYVLSNGILTVNEIASDELLQTYGIESTDLGSYNVAFDLTLSYDSDRVDIAGNFTVGDESTVKLTAALQNDSNFFVKLFDSNILDADKIILTAEATVTQNDTETVYKLNGTLDKSDAPEIVKMEGGVSLNGTEEMFDSENTRDMITHFLGNRQQSTMAESFWTNMVIEALNVLSGGSLDTADINSVKMSVDSYDALVIGETDKAGVDKIFLNAAPVVTDTIDFTYYSDDFKKDGTAGMIIYGVYTADTKKLDGKGYINYTLASKIDELADVDLDIIKEGSTLRDITELLSSDRLVMAEAYTSDGQLVERLYYGISADGNIVFAVELIDGTVTQIQK